MIIRAQNASQVELQAFVKDSLGRAVTLVAASVRVYSLTGQGTEQNLLESTSLSDAGDGVYRYVWEPTTLASGMYFAEYTLDDGNGGRKVIEDIAIHDFATDDTVKEILKITKGSWEVKDNTLTFYDADGVTAIAVFDLFDDLGVPSMNKVFKRVLR